MDAKLVVGLLGVIIGALIGGLSNVFLEAYKRCRDKKAVASLLAGEISGILTMTEIRGYKSLYERLLDRLEQGEDIPTPDILGGQPSLDPGIQASLDKIGLLSQDFPERLALFYQQLSGIRLDIRRLAEGKYDGRLDRKIALIREDLSLWNKTEKLGNALVVDLRKEAGTICRAPE